MTVEEFNNKWADYLEEGHYGLGINDVNVINYLDKEFEEEILVNPNFTYSQIKLKWGQTRVYANSEKYIEWEETLDKIIKSV